MSIEFATFVITLDEKSDRFIRVRERLLRAGLNFERVPGLLATALPDDVKQYFFTPTQVADSFLRLGEIGCHAAHIALSRRLVEQQIPVALVLEDDADFDEDLGAMIGSILAHAPPSWDIIRLSSPPKRAYVPLHDIDRDHCLVRYSKIPNVTTGYLLRLSGAHKLLLPGIRRQAVDEFMRRPWLHRLDTYGIVPAPVRQSGAASTIDAIQSRDRHCSSWGRLGRADWSNLPARCSSGIAALGWRYWIACLAINVADRLLKRFTRASLIHRCADWLRPWRRQARSWRATADAQAADVVSLTDYRPQTPSTFKSRQKLKRVA